MPRKSRTTKELKASREVVETQPPAQRSRHVTRNASRIAQHYYNNMPAKSERGKNLEQEVRTSHPKYCKAGQYYSTDAAVNVTWIVRLR